MTVDRHWESLPFISQLSEVCIDTLITPEIMIEIKYLSIFTLIRYVYPSVDPYPKDKLWIHQWIWIIHIHRGALVIDLVTFFLKFLALGRNCTFSLALLDNRLSRKLWEILKCFCGQRTSKGQDASLGRGRVVVQRRLRGGPANPLWSCHFIWAYCLPYGTA